MKIVKINSGFLSEMDLDSYILYLRNTKWECEIFHKDFLSRKDSLSTSDFREDFSNQEKINSLIKQINIATTLNTYYDEAYKKYTSLPTSDEKIKLRDQLQRLEYYINNLDNYFNSDENKKELTNLEIKIAIKAIICLASILTSLSISIPATLITALGFIILLLNKDFSKHEELIQRKNDALKVEEYIDSSL
ncbi:MAG: hypothetical protein IJB82_00380, partial [Bacilli bacterium]|nr:hypothetical protein [Bacilli bacterium]